VIGKRAAGVILQCAKRALPFAGTWCRVGELPDQGFERQRTLLCMPGVGERFCMLGRIDHFHATILADADAGLRRLDSSAADALPCFHSVEHDRIRMSSATAILGASGAMVAGGVLHDGASLTRIKRDRRQQNDRFQGIRDALPGLRAVRRPRALRRRRRDDHWWNQRCQRATVATKAAGTAAERSVQRDGS
jgi:hypothetical protein